MNVKSPYKKIIILTIIVAILVSSMAIYFYPHNKRYYDSEKNLEEKADAWI